MVMASPFIHQLDWVARKESDVSVADWRYQTQVRKYDICKIYGRLIYPGLFWMNSELSKDKFFYCYPNLQGRFSFDAGFKRYCRLLCVSSLSPLFSCCFVSASISAAILDILFFSHETTGIIIKYIFPTSAWFSYLGEKAYFRWVKRLRGKGKKNGLMENCFAEYWGRRHKKNDRIEKSLCIATLRDRKRFVCLFVFFKIVVKIKIRTIHDRKILIQGKL